MPIVYCKQCGYTVYNTTPLYFFDCPVCHTSLSGSTEDSCDQTFYQTEVKEDNTTVPTETKKEKSSKLLDFLINKK